MHPLIPSTNFSYGTVNLPPMSIFLLLSDSCIYPSICCQNSFFAFHVIIHKVHRLILLITSSPSTNFSNVIPSSSNLTFTTFSLKFVCSYSYPVFLSILTSIIKFIIGPSNFLILFN